MHLLLLALPAVAGDKAIDTGQAQFMPARPGAETCWIRAYNRAHLDHRPHQKVEVMTLCIEGPRTPPRSAATLRTRFRLDVRLRGGSQALSASGDCTARGSHAADCTVSCDGGGFALDRRGARQALLRLDSIRMSQGCDDAGDPARAFILYGGRDDREFLLTQGGGARR